MVGEGRREGNSQSSKRRAWAWLPRQPMFTAHPDGHRQQHAWRRAGLSGCSGVLTRLLEPRVDRLDLVDKTVGDEVLAGSLGQPSRSGAVGRGQAAGEV